ncbi:hypothetical protein BBJ28_00023334 [Nothophytophthora sp. Chile5]|nr:hypothetical protein BBJ28_00023334 [Nothophytophthora sp. Chile5]
MESTQSAGPELEEKRAADSCFGVAEGSSGDSSSDMESEDSDCSCSGMEMGSSEGRSSDMESEGSADSSSGKEDRNVGGDGAREMPRTLFKEGSDLFKLDKSADEITDERLALNSRIKYDASLRHFGLFCTTHDLPDPRQTRFPGINRALGAYIACLAKRYKTESPAETIRAAVAWHYGKDVMTDDGVHPADRWEIVINAAGQ